MLEVAATRVTAVTPELVLYSNTLRRTGTLGDVWQGGQVALLAPAAQLATISLQVGVKPNQLQRTSEATEKCFINNPTQHRWQTLRLDKPLKATCFSYVRWPVHINLHLFYFMSYLISKV